MAAALGDVEIVSVDSMQIYRGMDVGTAKPSVADRAAVPHHLVDVADPAEEWSVARFQAEARAVVREVEARGRRALLVGGTGLYVRAVLDDLHFPGEHHDVRAELEAATVTAGGVAAAYAELERRDRLAAARIEPGNTRRIVRALEVVRATGRPFSSSGPGLAWYGPPVIAAQIVGLWLPRPVLDERIARRFAAMRAAGLVEEVERLAAGPWSRTARQAIGYKEVLAHLDGRIASLDEALGDAVDRTRVLARRQLRWFRRDPRVRWLGAPRETDDVLPALLEGWAAA